MFHFLSVPRAAHRLCALSLATLALGAATAQAQTSLEPVVITGTRFADEAQNLPFGVSVITAQDIRRSGANSVAEAIIKLLGVPGRLDLNGGGEYALDLRGFGGTSDSNMVIVVDGIRISEGDTGGTRLAGIPIETVERIEVLRGSNAVLYGEGATGGVIVVTTSAGKGVGRRDTGQVYVAGGNRGRRELRGSATHTAGDFSFDLAAQRRLDDGHRDNFASGVGGASFTAQWQDGEGLRVVARHAEDSVATGLPGALTTAEYASDPRHAFSLTDHGRIEGRRNTLTAELRSGAWEFAADVGRRSKTLRSVNFGSPFDYDVSASTAAVRARHSGQIGGLANQFRFGVDHNAWSRDVLPIGAPDEQRNRAVYLKDDLTLQGGTVLSAGLRRESALKDAQSFGVGRAEDRVTAWDAGVVQPIGTQAQVYGRIGKSFRLPNVDEIGGTPLRTQTSRDIEAGAR